jgi:hypothetical protein
MREGGREGECVCVYVYASLDFYLHVTRSKPQVMPTTTSDQGGDIDFSQSAAVKSTGFSFRDARGKIVFPAAGLRVV